jgi:hypothetical protein
MKNSAAKFLMLTLFFALTTILSCGGEEREPQAPPPHEEEKMEHMEETIEEDGGTAETETDFTNEQEIYIDNVHEQMMVMGEKIQELKDHAQTKEGEVRETLEQELDELTAIYEKTANELAHIRDQSMDAWYEAKPRLENSLHQLEQAYLDTKAKFE